MDTEGHEIVSGSQLGAFMEAQQMILSEKEVGLLMKVLDRNRDGVLDYLEFFAHIQS